MKKKGKHILLISLPSRIPCAKQGGFELILSSLYSSKGKSAIYLSTTTIYSQDIYLSTLVYTQLSPLGLKTNCFSPDIIGNPTYVVLTSYIGEFFLPPRGKINDLFSYLSLKGDLSNMRREAEASSYTQLQKPEQKTETNNQQKKKKMCWVKTEKFSL